MNEEDPSDRFLRDNLKLISETPARCYYQDERSKVLVASWKRDTTENIAPQDFQQNALIFADLIARRKPAYVMVDCRHLEHEITYEQQLWYVQQTRALWLKSTVKKMAFVFKSNLAVQLGVEGLRDVAEEEGLPSFDYRIFETVEEAMNWVRS